MNRGYQPIGNNVKEGLATLLTIIGSLNGIFILAAFVQKNIQLVGGLLVIVPVMIVVAWFIYAKCPQRVLFGVLATFSVLLIFLGIWLSNMELEPVDITIIDPQNGKNVTMEYLVRGMASDSEARVYVLVHPLSTREIWVQTQPIVSPDGSWQVICCFGTETLGIGDQYEVIALATKENFLVNLFTGNCLRAGQKLKRLPQETNISNVVTVIRPE